MKSSCCIVLVSALLAIPAAGARVTAVSFGAGAPPPSLGGHVLTPFPPDNRPAGTMVLSALSPTGMELEFSEPTSLRHVPTTYVFWGHPYVGPAYYFGGADTLSFTMTLPPDTRAFAFGISAVDIAMVTVTTDDGTSIRRFVEKLRSEQFGFYVSDPTDPPIRTIQLTGYARPSLVGEFFIAVPEPSAAALLWLSLFLRTRSKVMVGTDSQHRARANGRIIAAN